jgi:peptide/nickel transport system substrate-binding protein
MIRAPARVSALAGLLAALAACGGGGHPAEAAGTAYFALTSPPVGFEPLEAFLISNGIMQRQVLETLTEYALDPADEFAVRPLLAESWECSPDRLTWTFTLRADPRFHDPHDPPLWPGRERAVAAADVVASWVQHADERNAACNTWSAYVGLFRGLDELHAALDGPEDDAVLHAAQREGVAGIRALDARRVRLILNHPDGFLLQRLASQAFAVIPAERALGAPADRRNRPVGSAIFALAAWNPGQSAVFRAVPGWRDPPPSTARGWRLPETVRFDLVRESATRLLLFEKGRLDRLSLGGEALATYVVDGRLKPEPAARGIRLDLLRQPELVFVVFNWRDPVLGSAPGDPELQQRRRALRRALALACPTDGWQQLIRGGVGSVPVLRFLPPAVPEAAALPEYPWRGPDLERARAALVEAGFPGGTGLPELSFDLTGSDAPSLSFGELYVANLKAIGVACTTRANEWNALRGRLSRGEFQISLQSWGLDWPDAAMIYTLFDSEGIGSETNLAQFARADFDTALARLRAVADPAERARLCGELEAILTEECVGVPLDHRIGYLLLQPWLEGAEAHPFDPIACKNLRLGQRP